VATEYEAMLTEGRTLSKLHKNVVVKVPVTADGLRAVRTFKKQGIRTNVTLCFSAIQAMLAARAGAAYISPFIGRIDDTSNDGIELIEQIVTIYRNYGYETEVLTASVRSSLHVVQAALIGSHCATLPMTVIRQLIRHPLTDVGLAKFLEDNKKASSAAK